MLLLAVLLLRSAIVPAHLPAERESRDDGAVAPGGAAAASGPGAAPTTAQDAGGRQRTAVGQIVVVVDDRGQPVAGTLFFRDSDELDVAWDLLAAATPSPDASRVSVAGSTALPPAHGRYRALRFHPAHAWPRKLLRMLRASVDPASRVRMVVGGTHSAILRAWSADLQPAVGRHLSLQDPTGAAGARVHATVDLDGLATWPTLPAGSYRVVDDEHDPHHRIQLGPSGDVAVDRIVPGPQATVHLTTLRPQGSLPDLRLLLSRRDGLACRDHPVRADVPAGVHTFALRVPPGVYELDIVPQACAELAGDTVVRAEVGSAPHLRVALRPNPRRAVVSLEGFGGDALPVHVRLEPLDAPLETDLALRFFGPWTWRNAEASVARPERPARLVAWNDRGCWIGDVPTWADAPARTVVRLRPARTVHVLARRREAGGGSDDLRVSTANGDTAHRETLLLPALASDLGRTGAWWRARILVPEIVTTVTLLVGDAVAQRRAVSPGRRFACVVFD